MSFRSRSTGVMTASAGGAASGTISLSSTYGRVVRIRIEGFDASTDYTITDADSRNVFTKTGLDATTALDFAVGYDGKDQSYNAAADTLDGVFHTPLTVTVANGGNATTGTVGVIVQV